MTLPPATGGYKLVRATLARAVFVGPRVSLAPSSRLEDGFPEQPAMLRGIRQTIMKRGPMKDYKAAQASALPES